MKDIVDTLRWYEQMGVDETISETPVNSFNQVKKKPTKQPVVANKNIFQVQEKDATLSGPSEIAINVRKKAGECKNLDELRELVTNFKDIAITKTATNTVFSDGNPEAEIMMVGEAPGAEEDARGIPFCGASGKMLDQMLSHIGLNREKNFYITNTIFWRPPGNRRPTPEELAICAPFVEKHVALIKPKLIILIGGTAVTALLDSNQGISKLRGNFYDYNNEYLDSPIKTTAIFHPSYLLRSPGQKRLAWKDCLMLKNYIKEQGIKI